MGSGLSIDKSNIDTILGGHKSPQVQWITNCQIPAEWGAKKEPSESECQSGEFERFLLVIARNRFQEAQIL